ncbi:MAG: tRNA U-34 5-methylaminomethyl-2-thiouridine biosynthesis protein [Gammaproteobacteria bacterium]
MTIVSAFLVPGSPLPFLQPDNPPWAKLAKALKIAGESLAKSKPDTIVIYSNEWIAVLDQLWQTRPHIQGVHVDHNWHEYGELTYDISVDTDYAQAAIEGTIELGIKAKGVDYDQFPVDTGTIVATKFLNPESKIPLLISSNNVYHDWDATMALGRVAAEQANKLNRKIAVVGVGGLSGSFYRHSIDIREDKIVSDKDDELNKNILELIESGDLNALSAACPGYAAEAKADMGFKQLAFLLGAMGENYKGGKVLAYGSVYGSGAAVVELNI